MKYRGRNDIRTNIRQHLVVRLQARTVQDLTAIDTLSINKRVETHLKYSSAITLPQSRHTNSEMLL
jgi:hypothetical protein